MRKSELFEILESRKDRSAWDRGVTAYALDMVDELELEDVDGVTEEVLLNGARDWSEYSYGGCALIYDGDIAERLCTPSELKRKRGGELAPNSFEEWLDVQSRACRQAAYRVRRAIRFGR